MGLFSREDRIRRKNAAREKETSLTCKTLQIIGRIPMGAEVELSFKPKEEHLIISQDRTNITLPYARIRNIAAEKSVSNNESKRNITSAVLGSGLLGNGVIGKVGRLASNFIPIDEEIKTIITLQYESKSGNMEQLRFSRDYSSSRSATDNGDDFDPTSDMFVEVVSNIICRNNEEITEL